MRIDFTAEGFIMAGQSFATQIETAARLDRDTRADQGSRKITLTLTTIHIERVVSGVKMRVHVPVKAYQGLMLTMRERLGGETYDIKLIHRDPDLSISLDTSKDKTGALHLQQRWADFFAQPVLASEAEEISPQGHLVSKARRRCMTHVAKRRPRRFARRKSGNRENLSIVRRNEREIICYE